MKKLLLSLLALATLTVAGANSTPGKPEVFNDDFSRIEQEFDGINQLEQVVADRQATYTELAAENNALLNNVSAENDLGAALLGSAGGDEKLLGIPGFFWGFCLGLLGVILVYVAIDDEDSKRSQGKKALWGCAAWSLIWLLYYLIVVATVFTSAG